MKVAYLLGSLNRGGTETLMLDVFRNASRASFEMIGIHRKGGAYQDEFYAAAPYLVQVTPKRVGFLRYVWRLRKILLREHVSVIHGQQPIDTFYGALASIGSKLHNIQTFHGFYPMKGIAGWLTRLSIRMSDDLCFVSRYEQEWYQRQMKIADEKCHVIYNGIDFSKFDSVVECGKSKVEGTRIKLCMVGNFVEVRDHVTLVKALAKVKSDFDFYFIGKRSEDYLYIYDECVRVCEENGMNHVYFLGGRGDVPALLKEMDGFVYSTDHDTFGIAVVEAMAAGLPIVVNDYPVMKEVCGEEESNYVAYYHSKDVDGCAKAIVKLLDDIASSSEEFKQKCKHNSVYVRERYSIESYIERLSRIYSEY